MAYKPTIGLEIHAELKTRSKMFCGCVNDPDEINPNKNVCPVCMGHPGTLPVVNMEAVRQVLRVGAAIEGEFADYTEFDRKNYFYPDIPKGYQISQHKFPLITGGSINGIAITRIHLEEDTGTSLHDQGDYSLVDFNRAGVPLMELVTEPVIHDAKTACDFAKEYQLLLRYLDASLANMEKGEFRVEANISISPKPASPADRLKVQSQKLGTKVEIKNLNSFRTVERAVAYEIERQTRLLEAGEKVVQETRGWDEGKQKTFSQRQKEESHDYRYFPEPDIPKFKLKDLSWANKEKIKKELPELPWEKRERLARDFEIRKEDIEMYVGDLALGDFFEKVVKELKSDKNKIILATNYITSDIVGLLKKGADLNLLSAKNFSELINMIADEKLSSRGAKDVLTEMLKSGLTAEKIAKNLDAIQTFDEAKIMESVVRVINANSKAVSDYKGGKQGALQYLIGMVMKELKGAVKPNLVQRFLEEKLKK